MKIICFHIILGLSKKLQEYIYYFAAIGDWFIQSSVVDNDVVILKICMVTCTTKIAMIENLVGLIFYHTSSQYNFISVLLWKTEGTVKVKAMTKSTELEHTTQ